MKEQLALLEQLQKIDNEIDVYEKDLARLPEEIQEIARSLVVSRRDISELKEKLEHAEKSLKKREQDLAVEQDKIKRSERRLLGIKNVKEYNALSREIKLGKKVAGEIEENVLTLMNEVEGLRKVLERREGEYAELEERLAKKKAEAEAVGARAKKLLSKLNSEKEKITVSLDRDYLKRYLTVKKVRGNAVAEMSNGICTACHMSVPPQLNIRVLKQEELIMCPNCHRILYVRPENIPEYNKLDA
uniref:Uncharacterized protein n=1 Tax=Desulfomonile tiedjei TaxID=2358 RepID=A0A7C4ARK3_9BACT